MFLYIYHCHICHLLSWCKIRFSVLTLRKKRKWGKRRNSTHIKIDPSVAGRRDRYVHQIRGRLGYFAEEESVLSRLAHRRAFALFGAVHMRHRCERSIVYGLLRLESILLRRVAWCGESHVRCAIRAWNIVKEIVNSVRCDRYDGYLILRYLNRWVQCGPPRWAINVELSDVSDSDLGTQISSKVSEARVEKRNCDRVNTCRIAGRNIQKLV